MEIIKNYLATLIYIGIWGILIVIGLAIVKFLLLLIF